MKSNIGTVDSVIRIVLGLAVLSLLFVLDGSLRYIGLLGVVFLVTGFVKVCPLYMPFGLSTCRTVPEKK
ncbi:MAG: DUF2892 domain-containing protein [Ignavibacteria bacterium]|nr:DUF2892 domain-containing protein [Ignavibacteria bacterium]